jgi:hypothetical protein
LLINTQERKEKGEVARRLYRNFERKSFDDGGEKGEEQP